VLIFLEREKSSFESFSVLNKIILDELINVSLSIIFATGTIFVDTKLVQKCEI
jgi:hypothetical protein